MTGRWPANVILSPGMAEALDQQSGYQRDGKAVKRNGVVGGMYSPAAPVGTADAGYGSGGGASRFFLTAGYEQWEIDWIYANGLRPCGDLHDTPTNS